MEYVSFSRQVSADLDDSTQYATVRTHGVVKALPEGTPVATLQRRRVLDRTSPVWSLYDTQGELIHSWRYSPDYQSLIDAVSRALANSEVIRRVAFNHNSNRKGM